MRSKFLLLLTLFFIGFFQSCKKETITEPAEINNPARPKYIEQADAYLNSYYTAGSLKDLNIDASIIYRLDSGRSVISVPLRVDGSKNFILISADSINGLKKGVLLHIDQTSNTSKGEKFNGAITIKEMNGNIKETRKIEKGFRVNNIANTTTADDPQYKVLPDVVVISIRRPDLLEWSQWFRFDFFNDTHNDWYGFDYVLADGSGGGTDYVPDPNAIVINFDDELTTEPIDLLNI